MSISASEYVDIKTIMSARSNNSSAYDQLVNSILTSPEFEAAVLNADSNISASTKAALAKITDDSGADNVGEALETIALAATTPMNAVTYADLVDLANHGKLVPGQQYRITDYMTTTDQTGTFVADPYHYFDIIVTADSTTKLNEVARAVKSESDTANYFATSKLEGWKLWYSLYNDNERFDWAVTDGTGKGVIYRMIDEFGNDCPYDFKNIKFGGAEDSATYTFGGLEDKSLLYGFGEWATTGPGNDNIGSGSGITFIPAALGAKTFTTITEFTIKTRTNSGTSAAFNGYALLMTSSDILDYSQQVVNPSDGYGNVLTFTFQNLTSKLHADSAYYIAFSSSQTAHTPIGMPMRVTLNAGDENFCITGLPTSRPVATIRYYQTNLHLAKAYGGNVMPL